MATGPVISGLTVNDSANASSRSIQQNLQVGDTAYGDRTYTWTSIPSGLLGDPWIRTAAGQPPAPAVARLDPTARTAAVP